MGEYKQSGRKMRVTFEGLGPDDLLLKAFVGTETISRLFSYEVEMIAENSQKITFDSVLGKKATIHLQLPDESSETHINGLVVRFAQGDRDDTFTTYRAELVPEAWRLSRKTQSKIFQRKDVPEILKATLKGFPIQWKLEGSYEKRDYCVQYRESDLDFASRLMEEEGIWYYFSHSDGSHEMVVGDKPGGFVDVKGDTTFVYEELEGGARDDNRVWAWEKEQQMRAGKVLLWDHCFELPHRHLDAEQQTVGSVTAGKDSHKLTVPGVSEMEMYDWPGAYAQRFDGINKTGGEQPDELQKIFTDNRRTAEIRMDEEAAPAVRIKGKSNVKHLVPGHKFTLKRHFGGGDGQYLLVTVQHAGEYGGDYRTGKSPLTYRNSFTCMPVDLPFRPPRVTPRPHVRGTQTAVVVGPSGEEIFTDKYSRVKVQFHWDRDEPKNEDSSCWVRVATVWAGRQWGAIHIPRIGQEVVVDFLEGDPDQPIVVGSVYNADMMPPYELPKNKTQSGLKSRSSPNGGVKNYNELRFEDKKGKEEVHLHAERNYKVTVESDETRYVGHDRKTTVEHDCKTRVKHDLELQVDNDRTTTIGHDDTETVSNNQSVTVNHDQSVNVSNDQTLLVTVDRRKTIGSNETTIIGLNRSTSVGGDDTAVVGGKHEVTVGRNEKLVVGGGLDLAVGKNSTEKVSGSKTITTEGSLTLKSGRGITIEAGSSINLKVGESSIKMTRTGIKIKGLMVEIEASGFASVKGEFLRLKGRQVVQIGGIITDVKGNAFLTARGGSISIG